VQNWLINEANLPIAAEKLTIMFYSGRYHTEFHSIFPMGDITALIPDELADICVLEEPEHLNWYKAPSKAWMEKFNHVVGIIHTNYVMYSRSIALGQLKGSLLYFINQGMCRAYCHKVIKLSAALQEFAPEKEVVCNVHGVRSRFLEIGDKMATKKFTKGAYFIGKMAWPKGLKELFDLMNYLTKRTGQCFPLDLYGNGPHLQDIMNSAKALKLATTFHGPMDHLLLDEYRVFVNPSLSEVLCTTIVEALAMGKWVVCAKHPSNDFFAQFPNCLFFSNEEEFAANIIWALHHDPLPLTREQRYTLSWEAATERFLQACMMTRGMLSKANTFNDKFLAWVFDLLGKGSHGDAMRTIAGVTNQLDLENAEKQP
jgi:digalactosyldiacylglycerol synthase